MVKTSRISPKIYISSTRLLLTSLPVWHHTAKRQLYYAIGESRIRAERGLLAKLTFPPLVKKFLHFMKPASSLPSSQQPATGPYYVKVKLKVKQSRYKPVTQRVPGRLPDFMTTAQDGDMVVSLTHRPPLRPGNIYLVLFSFKG